MLFVSCEFSLARTTTWENDLWHFKATTFDHCSFLSFPLTFVLPGCGNSSRTQGKSCDVFRSPTINPINMAFESLEIDHWWLASLSKQYVLFGPEMHQFCEASEAAGGSVNLIVPATGIMEGVTRWSRTNIMNYELPTKSHGNFRNQVWRKLLHHQLYQLRRCRFIGCESNIPASWQKMMSQVAVFPCQGAGKGH